MRLSGFALAVFYFAAAASAAPDIYTVAPITDDYFDGGYPDSAPSTGNAIAITLTPGEYEPASFVVRADKSRKELVLQAGVLTDAEGNELKGAELDIRIVKRWYQRSFGGYSPQRYKRMTSELLVYDDQLVYAEDKRNYLRLANGDELDVSVTGNLRDFVKPDPEDFPVRDANELQPLTLEKGESRQFWLTARVPEDAAAGIYSGSISLMQGEALLGSLPVQLEVLPFRLTKSMLEYGIYYRGQLDSKRPDGSVSSEIKSKAQMRADFNNMAAHGVDNPIIYQRWATGQMEDVLKLRREAGMESENLYTLSVSIVPNDEGVITSRLGEQVDELIELADGYGIEQVYFYARDEARGEGLLYQIPFWKEVRKHGGKIMAAGWPQTAFYPGNFNTTGGEEDLYVSLGTLSREEAARWHAKERRIFSYQNPTGGYEMPLSWRRNYGLLLWQYDYDGAFPYAWQHSFGDSWNDFDHHRYRDHNFTYPAVERPIDTVQWEAFREGVDDIRYLSTLLEMMTTEAAKDSGYLEQAQQWVAELRDQPLSKADLNTVRGEMASLIMALNGYAEPEAEAVLTRQPHLEAIEPDGTAVLAWNTAERRNSCVSIGGSEACGKPASREHGATVNAGDTDRSLNVRHETAERDGNDLLVSAAVDSAWRSSIAVDAGRSLIGWWRFSDDDDDLQDLSGYNHEGELKGAAELTDGWIGQGVKLPGDGSFINFPDIEIAENGTGTIEGWFRFRSFAKDRVKNMALFSGLYQHGDSNHFYFYRTNEHFQAGALLTRDTWHHIALTWNGDASTARMFIDGHAVPVSIQSEVEEIQAIDGLTIGRSAGYFGGLVGKASNTFDGDVDELRVWSRDLGAEEIRASWRTGAGRLSLRVKGAARDEDDWAVIGVNAAGQELTR